MGAAKRRGTKEQRVAMAIERDKDKVKEEVRQDKKVVRELPRKFHI